MFVDSLIDQYVNTQDTDLKYMTLRQDFSVQNIDELHLLVDKVLLPVLLQEPDSEIVSLVSFEVFPNAVSKLISSSATHKKRNQSTWFDDIVAIPLIEKNTNNRTNFLRQTLRNILKKIFMDTQVVDFSTKKDESPINSLLNHMKKINNSNDDGANYVIDWEILDFMTQLYYYGNLKMSKEVLFNILKLCPTEGELFETMKSALTKSIKAANREDLRDKRIVQLLSKVSVLEIVSHVWYQFSYIAETIFTDTLLPSLKSPNEKDDTTLMVLQTIYNFSPFYSLERITTGQTFLEPKLKNSLQELVQEVQFSCSLKPKMAAEYEKDLNDELEPEFDEDPGQQAYLEELRDDDESFELEDDVFGVEEENICEKITGLCKLILSAAQKRSLQTALLMPSPSQASNAEISELQNAQISGDTSSAIVETLKASSSLADLQMAVELLNQIAFTTENFDFYEACALLLPHMKQNKNFLSTIKVGNMSQTIDEGLTLRTMVYTALLQMITFKQPAEPAKYSVACHLIKEAVYRGIKDPDHTINELSFKILQCLLEENYDTIVGIDSQWYNETIHPKAIENIKKAYKRLETLLSSTDNTSDSTLVRQLECLFLDCYPAIK